MNVEADAGQHWYVSCDEFRRIMSLNLPRSEITALFSDLVRLNVLYMIARAGSGHIGTSFSSAEILSHLHLNEVDRTRGDILFSSKGHDAPAMYAILIATQVISEDMLHRLRRLDGLPGHPDVETPGMITNTGSLGMGISKAKGMILARRLRHAAGNVFVVTGDGELQEGQIWESLVTAANWKMGELTVIVDHNKLQSDYSVEKTSALGDLMAKFRAFGWHAERIDGHDIEMLSTTLASLRSIRDRPKVIVADTIKGKGVSFMEGAAIDSDVDLYMFHSGAPAYSLYQRAVGEILERVNRKLAPVSKEIEVVPVPAPGAEPPRGSLDALIPAYSKALTTAAGRRKDLVALDADLVRDMGLMPFAKEYPDRFFECGIAEQDMVSVAGGMALSGLLPIVHSFSCFLSTRPNEQIYNNATEGTKIIYVGGLSGVLPATPGHSHQSVREVSSVGGIPGLVVVAPSCAAEVGPLLDWCLETHDGPSFLRLASLPTEIKFVLPRGYEPELGRGVVLRDGADVVLVGAGPIVLAQAYEAAEVLAADGVSVCLVNLPWLNQVDAGWLSSAIAGKRMIVTLDDHYVSGGQGEKILAAIASSPLPIRTMQLGLRKKPPCGRPAEVLDRVGLSSSQIARTVLNEFQR